MRVMIFTPYGPRLEKETTAAILAQKWPGPVRWVCQNDNPHGPGRDSVLHQYQAGRRLFLASNDDALLIVESDIILPPEALLRLAALRCDCAYGVYRFRTSNVINIFERYPGKPRNEGESLSLYPKKLRTAVKAGVAPCSGGGLGCVLIRRHVMEQIEFRHEETGYCDTYFNRDLLRAGFVAKADMSVICGHKTETGAILWPDIPSL